MESIQDLPKDDAPILTAVWHHNGEILGVLENGTIKILGRLANGVAQPPREVRKRGPRKKKEESSAE